HVINLAAQEMLGKNGLKADAPREPLLLDPDDTETGFTRGSPSQDNIGIDQIDKGNDDIVPVSNPFIKLRKGIIKI
ncbi:hypothetical protein BGW38_010487, partial [Lunasporangiospora selenospora]